MAGAVKSALDWAKFLTALAETGNLKLACKACGCSRITAKRHYEDDPDFRRAWDEAIEEAGEELEAEARRRAVDGVAEPVISMGKIVLDEHGKALMVRKYSDKLLELLLRACNAKFRQMVVIPQAALDAARAGGLDAIAGDADPERADIGKVTDRGAAKAAAH